MHWRRKWQPTPVFLPGESQGRGSLVGCRLWGCTESDTTEATQQQQQQQQHSLWLLLLPLLLLTVLLLLCMRVRVRGRVRVRVRVHVRVCESIASSSLRPHGL